MQNLPVHCLPIFRHGLQIFIVKFAGFRHIVDNIPPVDLPIHRRLCHVIGKSHFLFGLFLRRRFYKNNTKLPCKIKKHQNKIKEQNPRKKREKELNLWNDWFRIPFSPWIWKEGVYGLAWQRKPRYQKLQKLPLNQFSKKNPFFFLFLKNMVFICINFHVNI